MIPLWALLKRSRKGLCFTIDEQTERGGWLAGGNQGQRWGGEKQELRARERIRQREASPKQERHKEKCIQVQTAIIHARNKRSIITVCSMHTLKCTHKLSPSLSTFLTHSSALTSSILPLARNTSLCSVHASIHIHTRKSGIGSAHQIHGLHLHLHISTARAGHGG